jgi:Uma2 family endonuclease
MSTKTLMTVEQFAQMPREEAVHFELVEGELIPVASGTPEHAWIRDGLGGRIREYLGRNPLGIVVAEVDCRTTGTTVRRPDISFLTTARWQLVNPKETPLPFSPDIAIEVLSPSESIIAFNRKVAEYLASGSHEVWVLDAENQEIMIRTADGARILRANDLLESPLLPGFSIKVGDALARP